MKALIALTILAVLALFVGLLKSRKLLLPLVLLGLAGVLALVMQYGCQCEGTFFHQYFDESTYRNMFSFDKFAAVFAGMMLVATLLISMLATDGFIYNESHRPELFALMLFSLCGGIVMVGSTHLVMLFLGIEILSIPAYVLAGSNQRDSQSNEAALKYFLMGAFTTGILLFGIALMYGGSGSMSLDGLMTYSRHSEVSGMFKAGMLLVLIAMCFKIGIAPFHFWGPDVYEGTPSIITSYMATVVKTAAIAATFRFFAQIIGHDAAWMISLVWMAALTMFIGNLTATVQSGFKRMLAYSSIAHAGYVLIAFFTPSLQATQSVVFYLAAYTVATIACFAVLIGVQQQRKNDLFESFNGLAKTNPLAAFTLTLALLSLAGIPPLAGFFAKYYLFSNGWAGYPWLILVAIINSAISIYYYFRTIIAMWFHEPTDEPLSFSMLQKVVLLLTLAGLFTLGLMPGLLLDFLG